MPKDNKIVTRSRNKKGDLSKMRKKHDTSSDSESEHSSESEYNSDSYEEEDEDEEEDELDIQEYRKFLAKTFPSNHINKKIKAGNKLKHVLKEDHLKNMSLSDEDEDDEEYIPKKSRTVTKSGKTKSKKALLSDSDEEVVSKKIKSKTIKTNKSKSKKIVSSESEEEDDDDDEEDEIKKKTDKPSKFNIIFTIGEKHADSEEDASDAWDTCSDDYEDDDEETENEDDSISSDAEEEDDEAEESEEEEITKKVKNKKEKEKDKDKDKDKEKISEKEKDNDIIASDTNNVITNKSESSNDKSEIDIITALKELQTKNKDNKLITECIKVCEDKIQISKKSQEKKAQKYKDRNNRIFKRILRDKNTMNDFDFFEKLEIVQQKKIIKELREINTITRIEKPYR